jgi:2-phosphosulfolactate phosphatase
MADDREVRVYLLPELVPDDCLAGSVAIVIDVLRASTTIVHALAVGCTCVRPCLEVEEARELAGSMRAGRVLLAGERHGQPLSGFDLGNSPGAFVPSLCRGSTLVFTTTNGTRALLRAVKADRVLVAAFVNYSAVCEQLRQDQRPVIIICAGTDREVSLEDTLMAGAVVDYLSQTFEVELNDAARLSWDCFENHGSILLGALEVGRGGARLRKLGYDDDIRAACQVDRFHLVPELKLDPLRVEVGAVGIVQSHWQREQQ